MKITDVDLIVLDVPPFAPIGVTLNMEIVDRYRVG